MGCYSALKINELSSNEKTLKKAKPKWLYSPWSLPYSIPSYDILAKITAMEIVDREVIWGR